MPQLRVRVWDLPTRLFHWLLVLAVAGLFLTAYVPGASMVVHSRLGYAVLVLLTFRLLWGFFGGYWSRFVRMLRPAQPDLGHTRLGTLSILAMVAILLVQVGTGLVSDDEIGFTGPLNHLVSAAAGIDATRWHKNIGQWLVVALVALHLAAIGFYLWVRRVNLVGPMLRGDKTLDLPHGEAPQLTPSRDDGRSRAWGLALLLVCLVLVWALVTRLPAVA